VKANEELVKEFQTKAKKTFYGGFVKVRADLTGLFFV
jgi:hypothetical protein